MSKLYEITTELAQINDMLIEAQGEMSTEIEQRLDELKMTLVEKATGIRKIVAMIETDAEGRNAEIKRLQAISKVQENGLERLKAYIKKNMEVSDLKTIPTPIGTFTICKNPASVEMIEATMELTPEQYRVPVPATWTPDKKLIKSALEEGYEVPGWKLINDKTNLRIK